MVLLPLRSDLPSFDLSVELDGATYGFAFRWNFRAETWGVSISAADGTLLASEVRVVVDFPIARRSRDARMPPGVLQALDTGGEHRDPLLEDLGRRVLVGYFAAGEL